MSDSNVFGLPDSKLVPLAMAGVHSVLLGHDRPLVANMVLILISN